MLIDTTQQIAEMPIFSLTGVDCLLGKGLRLGLVHIFHDKYSCFLSGVDLASETLTG
jgi:hypothetical protein